MKITREILKEMVADEIKKVQESDGGDEPDMDAAEKYAQWEATKELDELVASGEMKRDSKEYNDKWVDSYNFAKKQYLDSAKMSKRYYQSGTYSGD